METKPLCPSCGKPIAPNAPQGLCQECLLSAGFPTGTDTGGRPHFVPPEIQELAVKFPQLDILEFVGQGGMGAVYRVRQRQLDRIVALKILPPQAAAGPGFAERFTREARALAKLNHPQIVTLFEFGQSGGLFYFLMEYVDGLNLRQLLQAGRLAPKEALAIVPQICEALQYAHERGIVHRDIKPENILLSKAGRVKIADFGVAKIVGQDPGETGAVGNAPASSAELTHAGATLGTPQYMAPEQLKNSAEVDHRADIYSLGVVFYQMLTGDLPSGLFESPSRKVAIDVRLDEVVLRALEKEPERRYQQVSEVKERVETIAQTPAPGGRQPFEAPRQPRSLANVVGMVGLLLLAVAAGFAIRPALSRSPASAPDEKATSALNRPASSSQVNPVTGLPASNPDPTAPGTTNSGASQAAGSASGASVSNQSAGLPVPPHGQSPSDEEIEDDPRAVEQVKKLIFNRRYEEALQRCLALYERWQASTSLSSLLPDWIELGRRFPKAKAALVAIRDRDAREFAEGRGYSDLFMEVTHINRALQDEDATVKLFKSIQSDKELAQRCFYQVDALLVQRGDYELCLSCIGDPEAAFERYHRSWELTAQMEARLDGLRQRQAEQLQAIRATNSFPPGLPMPSLPGPPKMADKSFVGQTCLLIECLVGVGRKGDAEKIRDQAVEVLDNPRLKSAVADAEARIQKRAAAAASK